MNRRPQRPQSIQQITRRSIQEFILNTIHAASFSCPGVLPFATSNDLFQRNAITGAAPCGNHHVWLARKDFISGLRLAFSPNKPSPPPFHNPPPPPLRQNQRPS